MALSLGVEPGTDGEIVVVLAGELQAADAGGLREALHHSLSHAAGSVIFDLGGLTGWSVGCQAAVVDAVRSVRLAGARVAVIGLAGAADREAFASGLHESLFCSPAEPAHVLDLTKPRRPALTRQPKRPATTAR